MRRIGILLAVFVLLAGAWLLWRTPRDSGRAAIAPGSSTPERPQVRPRVDPRDAQGSSPEDPERSAAEASELAADEAPVADAEGVLVCVVDTADVPIVGARVRVLSSSVPLERVTDDEGRCRLPFEPASEDWSMAVEAEGFFPAMAWKSASDRSCVRLHALGRLAGRVLERDTRLPVAGATVWVPWRYGDEVSDGVRTDATGRFQDVAIPLAKSFHLAARAAGFLEDSMLANTLVVAPEEPEPTAELLLERALVAEFQVVDSASGVPIAAADVLCWRAEYQTDARGVVRVDRSLRPGDVRSELRVEAAGYCTTVFELSDVAAAAEPTRLGLPRASRITGVLRDAQGEPWSGVHVTATLTAEIGEEFKRSGRLPQTSDSAVWPTNARWNGNTERASLAEEDPGRFEIDRIPPGLPVVELLVQERGRTVATRSVGPVGPPGSTLFVEWQLEPPQTAEVRGRLLLNGAPHSGFVDWKLGDGWGHASVADDGHFVFTDVVPGRVELQGSLAGPRARWGVRGRVSATVEARSGEVVQLDLACEIATAEVRGTLHDAAGEPAPGIEVQLVHEEDHAHFSGASDAEGLWSIPVAAIAGGYRIDCDRPLREAGQEVRPGAEDVALHLLALGRLRYRALDASTGERLPSVLVSWLQPGREARMLGFPLRDAPDTAGWTEVDLAEGSHELGAWTLEGAHRTDLRSVHIVAGGVSEVEFRLEPAEGLSLQLSSDGGPIPDGHVVLLLPEDEWPLVSARLVEGRPRVSFDALAPDPGRSHGLRLMPGRIARETRLAPGRYRFKVFPDDVAIEPEWVDVPAAGVVEVRWESRP